MLCYGAISYWNMKLLQAVLEKFSVDKIFYYWWWFFEKNFKYPDSTCQALALNSKEKNLKNFSEFFIFSNIEILTHELDTRPKICVLTIQRLTGPRSSVTDL